MNSANEEFLHTDIGKVCVKITVRIRDISKSYDTSRQLLSKRCVFHPKRCTFFVKHVLEYSIMCHTCVN